MKKIAIPVICFTWFLFLSFPLILRLMIEAFHPKEGLFVEIDGGLSFIIYEILANWAWPNLWVLLFIGLVVCLSFTIIVLKNYSQPDAPPKPPEAAR